ncbi:unnamed protein product, partial [Polarella glacialis]
VSAIAVTDAAAPDTRRKLRSMSRQLDSMQDDVFNDRWQAIKTYPATLRSYVPVFTEYTDSVFDSGSGLGRQSRIAMRYEVGRFFSALVRLTEAAEAKESPVMQQ